MTTQTAVYGFQDGYQAALADIKAAYERGGWDEVQEWLDQNLRTPKD